MCHVPEDAARRGLTSTFCAPIGNLARKFGDQGDRDRSAARRGWRLSLHRTAKVFVTETAAIAAIRGTNPTAMCGANLPRPIGAAMRRPTNGPLPSVPASVNTCAAHRPGSAACPRASIGHVAPEALSRSDRQLRDATGRERSMRQAGSTVDLSRRRVRVGPDAAPRSCAAARRPVCARSRADATRGVGRTAGCQRRAGAAAYSTSMRFCACSRRRKALRREGPPHRATALPADAATPR